MCLLPGHIPYGVRNNDISCTYNPAFYGKILLYSDENTLKLSLNETGNLEILERTAVTHFRYNT